MTGFDTHEKLARNWIETWNTRDLERILALYSEDAQMSSQGIAKLGLDDSGQVAGKENLRRYWSLALSKLPNLHFRLLDTFAGPDSVIVRYLDDRGHTICEYLRLNRDGKIIQGSANHLVGQN